MEVHILLLSSMTRENTRKNLSRHGITFDCADYSIQKFRWSPSRRAISVSLWVACQHPVVEQLAESFMPHMDACVCWYHDHDGLSCLKVLHGMSILQAHSTNVWMMATTYPTVRNKHDSRVRKYYCTNGFPIVRLTKTLGKNIEEIVSFYISINKTM